VSVTTTTPASEFSFLAALCQGHDSITNHTDFDGRWFTSLDHQNTFNVLRDLAEVGHEPDAEVVISFLEETDRRADKYIVRELFNEPVSGTALDYHKKVIRKNYDSLRVLYLRAEIERAAKDGAFEQIQELSREAAALEAGHEVSSANGPWQLKSGWSAVEKPAPMRSIVIEGLARLGEVVNIVAATKIGKSWLALLLLLCVSTGRDWLGRRTTKGRVLLLDNELHTETIQNRIHAVATAAGIVQRPDDAAFDYIELRGEAVGIGDIECQLSAFQPGDLTLIVMDAKYRFFSKGMEENSNDDQTAFHNACDRLAKRLNCVIVLVHHSTKGDQGGKAVVDVGSGGGSQARAADCHLVLRPHEGGDDLCVLDAELRTFKKVESQTLRWSFPLWSVDESVEATVKQAQTRNDATSEKNVKTKITSILQMLRLAPGNIHSENKLSNNHAASPAYRAAIAQLQETGEIEWLDDFKEPRAQQITGGWRLSVRSDS
jgi:RecA-family ATPase